MENPHGAKKTIDTLLAFENRITGADKALFKAQGAGDIMMDRDFTDFIAQLDISGFTAGPGGQPDFHMNGDSPAHFNAALEDASYESLQALTLTLVRTERFAPGLMNSLYEDGWFDRFFGKLKSIKEDLQEK